MANKTKKTPEQIRAQRIKSDKERAKRVKRDQINECRFVTVEIQTFKLDPSVPSGWTRTGSYTKMGLQYENHVIFEDGLFRALNRRSVRIFQKYDSIPPTAPEYLKNLYWDWFMGYKIVVAKGIKPYSEPVEPNETSETSNPNELLFFEMFDD